MSNGMTDKEWDEMKALLSPNIQRHHHFFWNSSLSQKRMEEISNWVGTLTESQRDMLEDIVEDARVDEHWNANYEG